MDGAAHGAIHRFGGTMGRLILSRLAQALIVILVISFVAYMLLFTIADPVALLAGQYATQENIEDLRESLGLNDPILVQYGRWLWSALHGRFGESLYMKEDSMSLIADRLPASFALILSTLGLSLVVGIGMGLISAVYYRSWVDRVASVLSVLGISAAPFWVALLAIYVFAVKLRILPSSGYGGFRHMILPAATLSLFSIATFSRLVRDAMVESLNSDYVRTALAKGVKYRIVVLKHALRNSIIPVVTVAAMRFAQLFAFAVVTERIFAWPGSGRLLLHALQRLDYPLVIAYLVVVSGLFVGLNLVCDLIYGVIDPRIRN